MEFLEFLFNLLMFFSPPPAPFNSNLAIWYGFEVKEGGQFMGYVKIGGEKEKECSSVYVRSDPPTVLCAHHCAVQDDYGKYQIYLGSYVKGTGLLFNVIEIIPLDGNQIRQENDMVIMILETTIDFYHFSPEIIKISNTEPTKDSKCKIYGFGMEFDGIPSEVLRYGDVKLNDDPTETLVFIGWQSSAPGDSGGAAVCENENGVQELVGILVRGTHKMPKGNGKSTAINLNSPRIKQFLQVHGLYPE